MVIKKFFITTTILTFLSIIFFTPGCWSKNVVPKGKILAEFTYNGSKHVVTLKELEQEISELPRYKQSKYQDLKGKKEYLTLMIESRLILEIAKAQGLDKDPEILKKVEDYLHQLMVEKITKKEVDEKVKVADEDLKKYYEEHKKDYVEPERVRMTCICLDNEELAKKTFKQIKEGKDMLKLAKALSDDRRLVGPGANSRNPGDTGFFSRNVSKSWKPFVDASFKLKVGEMYPKIMNLKIQDKKYYLIFKKKEEKPERQQTFDEVRKRVKRKVQEQKKKELMNKWVSKIRKEANLKEYFDKIPAPPKEKPKKRVEKTKTTKKEKSKPAAPSGTKATPEKSQKTNAPKSDEMKAKTK